MPTGIQWTDETVNFWVGCQKISPGCKYCYMYREEQRWSRDGSVIRKTQPNNYNKAGRWHKPRRIFTCSFSDFFLPEADEWREEAWNVIRATPQHAWQILTKRPELIKDRLPKDWGDGWHNVWIGVSVESDDYNWRIEELLKIPAAIRFISYEPLLSNITKVYPGIDWIIIGGESGNNTGKYLYRPTELSWIQTLGARYKELNTKVFIKQLGTHLAKQHRMHDRHGGEMDEWHPDLRVREIPDFLVPPNRPTLFQYSI